MAVRPQPWVLVLRQLTAVRPLAVAGVPLPLPLPLLLRVKAIPETPVVEVAEQMCLALLWELMPRQAMGVHLPVAVEAAVEAVVV